MQHLRHKESGFLELWGAAGTYECNSFVYEAPAVHISGTKTAALRETDPEPRQTKV